MSRRDEPAMQACPVCGKSERNGLCVSCDLRRPDVQDDKGRRDDGGEEES